MIAWGSQGQYLASQDLTELTKWARKELQPDAIVYDSVSAQWGSIIGQRLPIPIFGWYPNSPKPELLDASFGGPSYKKHLEESREHAIDKLHRQGFKYISYYNSNEFGPPGNNKVFFFSYPAFEGYDETNTKPPKYSQSVTPIFLGHPSVTTFLRASHDVHEMSDTQRMVQEKQRLINKPDARLVFCSMGGVVRKSFEFFMVLKLAYPPSSNYIVAVHPGRDRDGDHWDVNKLTARLDAPNFIIQKRFNMLELLPITSIFIAHGGANSAMEGMACKVPMIVLPWFSDQYSMALKLKKQQVGFPIPKRLSPWPNGGFSEAAGENFTELEKPTKQKAISKWIQETSDQIMLPGAALKSIYHKLHAKMGWDKPDDMPTAAVGVNAILSAISGMASKSTRPEARSNTELD